MASTNSNITRRNIFDKVSDYLKYIDAFEISSTLFSSLGNDYQRVSVVYYILESAGLLPDNVIKTDKSCTKAEEYRNEGNIEFMKKQDINAIKCYTLSIANAPFGSKELSLAFANRSAVTYSLSEYLNSLIDIDSALEGQYPEHLKYKLFERKGKCLSKLGKEKSAKENFIKAIQWLEKSILNEIKKVTIREDLENEIMKCNSEDKVQQKAITNEYMPDISNSANLEIISASSAIKIEFVKNLGRHLVAAKDILPGEVLVVEKPYASIVLPNAYTLYCHNCHRRCHSLLPCATCNLVLYCCEACRKESWSLNHEIECKVLPSFLSFGLNNMELLSLRILLTATNLKGLENFIQEIKRIEKITDLRTKGFCDDQTYNSSEYRTVHHLIGNTELRNSSDLFRRSVIAACILHYVNKCTGFFPDGIEKIAVPNFKEVKIPEIFKSNQPLANVKLFVGGLLLRYLQSLPSNAHEITEMIVGDNGGHIVYDSYEMGAAAYPVLSLINHSCDPNVVRHSHNGNTAVLTAIQFIPKGEQIFDNYGYHHAIQDKQSRQRNLKHQYYFTCNCNACIEDWPFYHQMPADKPVYLDPSLQAKVEQSSEVFKAALNEIIQGDTDGKLELLFKHLTLLHKAVKRPWKEYSECQEAIKQCLSVRGNCYILPSA